MSMSGIRRANIRYLGASIWQLQTCPCWCSQGNAWGLNTWCFSSVTDGVGIVKIARNRSLFFVYVSGRIGGFHYFFMVSILIGWMEDGGDVTTYRRVRWKLHFLFYRWLVAWLVVSHLVRVHLISITNRFAWWWNQIKVVVSLCFATLKSD
jgi:hypothetical protein